MVAPPRPIAVTLAALAALLAARGAAAFEGVAVGDPLPNPELPTLDGGRAHVLGAARANVFVFFRPGQDHSVDTLVQLATLEREFEGKSVRFVAVTSDAYDAGSVREVVKEVGLRMPVLVDVGDALYGALGVRLHPVTGIADARGRLFAYQHFLKINQLDRIRGRVRLLLGEIGEAEMGAIVAPPAAKDNAPRDVAMRRVQLARRLLERGRAAAAADSARRALELDPRLAVAHAVLAEALAADGRCADAQGEAQVAAKLGGSAAPAIACRAR
jgi:peroxiredoxin